MKYTTLIALVLTALLSACASHSPYKSADSGRYGYKEKALGEDRYRVTFTQRGNDTAQAMDYALLRAAEVTLLQGYDWFSVVDRQTLVDREKVPSARIGLSRSQVVTRDCGLLGCSYSSRPVATTRADVSTSTGSSEVEVMLEVRLGKGVRPENGDSYSASETRAALQPGASE